MAWQSGAKRDAKQRTTKNAPKYNQADCDGTHEHLSYKQQS